MESPRSSSLDEMAKVMEKRFQHERKNIVIIGGGVIGCTSAYYLTRHPKFDPSRHTITIVEAARIANAASGKAGGLLASWAPSATLAALSFDLHSDLAAQHGGDKLWGYRRIRCGQLTAVGQLSAASFQDEQEDKVETLIRSKSPIQLGKWWKRETNNPSGLPDDLNWFKTGSAQTYEALAGVESTAQVHPLQFTLAILKLAENAGARVILGTVEHIGCGYSDEKHEDSIPLAACHDWHLRKVNSITYTDKVTARRHTIPATTIVLAAGPWTWTLLPNLRMLPLRAHSVSIKVSRPMPAYCLFAEVTIEISPPLTAAETALKSSTERIVSAEIYTRPGNEIYICGQGEMSTPLPSATKNVPISELSCRGLIEAVTSVSEELGRGEVTTRRACYLPVVDTDKGRDPLIGYTGLHGLLLATGHSCWGISNAPATGMAMSELIFDGAITCVDADTFDPQRILPKYDSRNS